MFAGFRQAKLDLQAMDCRSGDARLLTDADAGNSLLEHLDDLGLNVLWCALGAGDVSR